MKHQMKSFFSLAFIASLSFVSTSFADSRDLKSIMKDLASALNTITKSTAQDAAELAADQNLEKFALEAISVPPANLKADEIVRYTDLLNQIVAKGKLLEDANARKDSAAKTTILADIVALKKTGHLEFK